MEVSCSSQLYPTNKQKVSMTLGSLRQTAVEMLACALCDIFPGTQLVENRVNALGFMCAVVLPGPIDKDALALIEERMHAIARQNPPIRMMEMMPSNAIAFLMHHKQPIKAMKLEGYLETLVSLIQFNDFIDTCELVPLGSLSEVKAFKLQQVETREPFENEGDEEVTCFYGTAFFDKAELKKFLKRAEIAKQRDHRIIGREMQLYVQLGNTGSWLWKPKGMELREQLRAWEAKQWESKKLNKVGLPSIIPSKEESENSIYIDGNPYEINFDTGELYQEFIQVSDQLPSYYSNRQQVYSFLPYSQLEGLLLSRNGEIDEVHCFCKNEQVVEELISGLQIIEKVIRIFPFEFEWALCTQCPKGFKNRKIWKEAAELLQSAVKSQGLEYLLDQENPSQYGPKIEIRISDALGRKWAGPNVLLNVPSLPSNDRQSLARITQTLLGPIERFIALLVENTEGNLPLWLSPEQVRILPVSRDYFDDAMAIANMVQFAGARSSIDKSQGNLGEKVHGAMTERVPYVIIVGERERQQGVVTVRSRVNPNEERKMTLQAFMEQLREQLKEAEEEQNKRSFS